VHGHVRIDAGTRALYATDASNYGCHRVLWCCPNGRMYQQRCLTCSPSSRRSSIHLGCFNPGVRADPRPLDADRRVGRERAVPVRLAFGRDGSSLAGATQRCVGVGACQQLDGPGVVCPSFQVTREKRHSTRGRTMPLHRCWTGWSDCLRRPLPRFTRCRSFEVPRAGHHGMVLPAASVPARTRRPVDFASRTLACADRPRHTRRAGAGGWLQLPTADRPDPAAAPGT
jgi:hypothetical protein